MRLAMRFDQSRFGEILARRDPAVPHVAIQGSVFSAAMQVDLLTYSEGQ